MPPPWPRTCARSSPPRPTRSAQRVDEQIAAKLADAETRIAATKTKALASVDEIATETASAVVEKLSGRT